MRTLEKLSNAVIGLDEENAEKLTRLALEEGIGPVQVLQKGILNSLEVIGKKFEGKEYFLAELIVGGEIARKCVNIIKPYLPKGEGTKAGTVVLGTVKDDIHDIGKNLVAAQLRMNGFEVYDIGVDQPSMNFIDKAEEVGANIIAMSAFLTSTIPYCTDVVNYLKDMGLRHKYRVIIGGGTTSEEYARSVGADGWAPNAIDAVRVCKNLIAG